MCWLKKKKKNKVSVTKKSKMEKWIKFLLFDSKQNVLI